MADVESLITNDSSRDDDIARWRWLKKLKRILTREEEAELSELDDDFEGLEERD